jgi:hypothetical protein
MRKVLLVINNDAFGRQMARWALVIKRHGQWEPIIYISADYMERHIAACREEGILVLSSNALPSRKEVRAVKNTRTQKQKVEEWNSPLHPIYVGLLHFLQKVKKKLLPFRILDTIIDLSGQVYFMRNLIRQHQVSGMIISESSPANGAPIYIRAAHLECAPIVTLPIEKATTRHYADNYLHDSALSLKRPVNRLISIFYPHWVITHKGRHLVRVLPELILALEWLRLRPPHPWQLVDNMEDSIAVDSQESHKHYSAEGIPLDRMTVIGNAEQDILYEVKVNTEELKSVLCEQLGMPRERPILLSPLVQEHFVSGRPECDFQDYSSMVEFWVKSLGEIEGYNVIVNLHPSHSYKQDARKWDYIEQWGVKICRKDIATLIPLCDIFVAAGSSTIPWAIACGKPVIDYNIYRYGLNIYHNTPGVISVVEQQDFLNALRRLTQDPVFYAEVRAYQAAHADQWGFLDGKASERLTRLLDRLVEGYQKC